MTLEAIFELLVTTAIKNPTEVMVIFSFFLVGLALCTIMVVANSFAKHKG